MSPSHREHRVDPEGHISITLRHEWADSGVFVGEEGLQSYKSSS